MEARASGGRHPIASLAGVGRIKGRGCPFEAGFLCPRGDRCGVSVRSGVTIAPVERGPEGECLKEGLQIMKSKKKKATKYR